MQELIPLTNEQAGLYQAALDEMLAYDGPFVLEGPISSVQGHRVTHLRYRLARS